MAPTTIATCGTIVCITYLGSEIYLSVVPLGEHVLTEQDRDNIRAFKLRMVSNMPRTAFDQMRFAFQHKLDISSYWVILHRLAILSEIEPVWYDCCVNSCLAYTGEYEALDCCPDCNATRFNDNGKPRRKFCYLPLIPRLQGYFQNPRMVERLSY